MRSYESLKIAYVTPFGAQLANIDDHLAARLESWQACGVRAKVIRYGPRRNVGHGSAVRTMVHKVVDVPQVLRELQAFSPDVIYARWDTPIPHFGPRLSAVAPLVWDVHMSDLSEAARRLSTARRVYLRVMRKDELKAAQAVTFVTRELVADPDFAWLDRPYLVCPNAASQDIPVARNTATHPRVGYAVGNDLPWQGIDRLQALARQCPTVTFRLCAPSEYTGSIQEQCSATNIDVLTFRSREAYLQELATWSIGLGTLALDRSHRIWASPLKVRDYVSIGLPTVLPYRDDILDDLEDPMLFKIYGAPDVVDALSSALPLFLQSSRGQSLRESTRKSASHQRLERRRLDFLIQVTHRGGQFLNLDPFAND